MHLLYKILEQLDSAGIHYTLARYREDMVMICVTVPGKRIEIDVSSSGEIETSIFSGDESVESGIEIIEDIINSNRE
jgi:hypothetical protein